MANAVLGRAPELLVAGRFVESLTSGPAACVFVGDAGIGKTALWRDTVAAARAGGACVLECAPTEAETALAYSSLADLFSGIEPPVFAGLPAPQREALEVALLRAGTSDAVAGQRAVATATTSVMIELATSSPVLVAVDDTQWLDPPSARVLDFAARRLAGSLASPRTRTAR